MLERGSSFENQPSPESHPMTKSTADPFLAEAWERKAESERGEDQNEFKGRDYDSYLSIITQIDAMPSGKKKDIITKQMGCLQKGISKYLRSIALLEEKKVSEEVSAVENADTLRKQAHTGIVDDLNILSRAFLRAGLDNSWRSDIGLTRKDATRWAWKIAKMLSSEEGS